MDFIINNWYLIVAAVAVIVGLIYIVIRFFKMPSAKQMQKVREWLLFAVTEAEKELGNGTGKLKLRAVYDRFLSRFKWISYVITFEKFAELVDEALEEMRTLLDTNKNIANFVEGTDGE